MIGVFDSGAGGLFAAETLRSLRPKIDIAFFADRENAPFGIKNKREIVDITARGIDKLLNFGAEKVLIACCTASTVFDMLPEDIKEVSVPIIQSVSQAAADITKNRKIGILSTEATLKSGSFPKEILKILPTAQVVSYASRALVSLADAGESDGKLGEDGKKIIMKEISPFLDSGIDTLVLGCTHFAAFETEIGNRLGVSIVNSAKAGARAIAENTADIGCGNTVYL